MDCLTKTSELWQNIKKTLEENNAIGKALELYCQKHDQSTMVATVKDFDQVKEGGCNQYCNELMACGHLCSSLCHIINENHEMIKCREPCRNTCPRNHPCKLFCYEKCQKCFVPVEQTLPCQHVKQLPCHVDELTYLCVEMIDDVSPLCKHNVKRKCHQKAEDAACTVPCEDRLDCGHACTQHCHKRDDPDHIQFKCPKPCERLNKKCSEDHVCQKLCFEPCGKCSVKVTFQLPCGHEISLPCSTDISKIKCYKKCVKNCPQCKKRCKKLCHEDCHPCMFMVKKTIPECGHEAQVPCSMPPTREYCQQKCELIAPCGHQCKSMCRKACGVDRCMEIVKSYDAKPLCGHSVLYFVCHQRNAVSYTNAKEYLKFCQEPCDAILECGDPCRGTCGECWQGRLHKTCQKNCGSTLICGHICNFPCRQLCPPCNQQCNFKCKHSHCPKSCGVPCVTCMETCDWRCEHSKCTKKCGEMCNRKPCTEPCKLKLTCGHDCIGFCGEPCPQYCRICNPEITEIVLGYEDEPDARFVLLVDCNHTIESRALDQHLSTAPEGGEIVMKVCPLCKTPITKTLRYMNYVKQTYQHIINVKKKIFGDNLKNKKKDLAQKLQLLVDMDLKFFAGARELRKFLLACHDKLVYSFKNKHQISQRDLAALTYYHQVLLDVTSRKGEFQPTNEAAADLFAFLNRLVVWLHRCNWCVNRQQMIDFGDELRRYHKMVDFCKLLENELYAPHKNYNNVAAVVASVRQTLFGLHRFTAHVEDEVQRLFGDLQKELRSSKPLTSSEKRMINEAMRKDFYGGGSGHWFTCSKGHYYCITECGGATQKANCPECGEIIGGANHRYVPTARLASDMDGASKPAWSSGHDMRNFAFED